MEQFHSLRLDFTKISKYEATFISSLLFVSKSRLRLRFKFSIKDTFYKYPTYLGFFEEGFQNVHVFAHSEKFLEMKIYRCGFKMIQGISNNCEDLCAPVCHHVQHRLLVEACMVANYVIFVTSLVLEDVFFLKKIWPTWKKIL